MELKISHNKNNIVDRSSSNSNTYILTVSLTTEIFRKIELICIFCCKRLMSPGQFFDRFTDQGRLYKRSTVPVA